MKKRKKQRSSTWIFYLIILALGLIIFFVNKDTIDSVLEETQLVERIQNRKSASETEVIIEAPPSADSEAAVLSDDQGAFDTEAETDTITIPPQREEPAIAAAPESKKEIEKTDTPARIASQQEKEEPPATPKESEKSRFRTVQLYFLKQSRSTVQLAAVTRTLPKSSTPLSENIRVLLRGPEKEEVQSGIITLIPPKSKLLSAWVKDSIAYLNFNTEFRFNQYGSEGSEAQIQQIVTTAIQFPTVNSVQILIEGKKIDFLSGDGIYIGKPISQQVSLQN